MTVAAVLFATAASAEGVPAAALKCGDDTLLTRLVGQLASLEVTDVLVLTRPGWEGELRAAVPAAQLDVQVRASADVAGDLRNVAELAASGEHGQLVLGSADVLTHREALAGLLADPRVVSGVLTSTGSTDETWTFHTRSERGRLVSAESPYHCTRKPSGRLLGFVKVAARDQEALANSASRLAELAAPPLPERWEHEFEHKRGVWRLEELRARAPEPRAPEPRTPEHREAGRSSGTTGDREAATATDAVEPDDLDYANSVELDGDTEARLASRAAHAREDAIPLLVVGLVRAQVHLAQSYLRELFWARPLSQQAADRAVGELGSYDEERVLLDSAVKGSDGFFTTFFVSPYSRFIARWAARHGWRPNGVTTVSMALGVVAAVLFGTGTRAGLIGGAVVLQLAFTLDCVDGQLARYTREFSKFGAWLDSVFDRGKEYVCYAGLGVGAVVGFDGDVWILATGALALQTLRHTIDFSFASARHHALASLPKLPLEQPEDRAAPSAGEAQVVEEADQEDYAEGQPLLARVGSGAVRLSRALESQSWMRWLKKIVVLPIGERFALISVTAAIWSPRITFLALLVWGGAALLYQLAGKVLRSVVA